MYILTGERNKVLTLLIITRLPLSCGVSGRRKLMLLPESVWRDDSRRLTCCQGTWEERLPFFFPLLPPRGAAQINSGASGKSANLTPVLPLSTVSHPRHSREAHYTLERLCGKIGWRGCWGCWGEANSSEGKKNNNNFLFPASPPALSRLPKTDCG